jgi:hypothetical protein
MFNVAWNAINLSVIYALKESILCNFFIMHTQLRWMQDYRRTCEKNLEHRKPINANVKNINFGKIKMG